MAASYTRLQASELAIAAGIAGGVGISVFGVLWAASDVEGRRCRDQEQDSDDQSPLGSCWPFFSPASIPAGALSLSTVVLSGIAGDRFGIADRLAGKRLPRRTRNAHIWGGVGSRLLGGALLIGGFALVRTECGSDAAENCHRRYSYGSLALLATGAAARAVGTGLFGYGIRHFRNERHRWTLSASITGLSGRF